MAVYKRKRQNYCKGDSINAFNHETKIFIQILNWRVLFLSFVVHRCCSSSSELETLADGVAERQMVAV